jgi:dipeptidyl aminopeptidase/acylaminoacyl peptidase
MIDNAVAMGLADPARLALAGHSSGAYLAALGASITKNKYKAAICWSGASDLASLTGTSQTPEFQFSL